MQNVNLILITPHGRSGSLFLQSLLDGHSELASIPGVSLKYDINLNYSTLKDFIDSFAISYRFVFEGSLGHKGELGDIILVNEKDEENIEVNIERFKQTFINYLKRIRIEDISHLQRRDAWIAIHYAYLHMIGKETDSIRYLVFHEHNYSSGHQAALADFPNSFYFATIRDPREHWLSMKKLLKRKYGKKYYFFHNYLFYTQLFSYSVQVSRLNSLVRSFSSSHILLIDLNYFHLMNQKAMKYFCNLLGIGFEPVLLQSTFGEKLWNGNSSDLNQVSGFDESKVKLNWINDLSKKDSGYIEHFLPKEMKLLKYRPTTNPIKSCRKYPWFSGYLFLMYSSFSQRSFTICEKKNFSSGISSLIWKVRYFKRSVFETSADRNYWESKTATLEESLDSISYEHFLEYNCPYDY